MRFQYWPLSTPIVPPSSQPPWISITINGKKCHYQLGTHYNLNALGVAMLLAWMKTKVPLFPISYITLLFCPPQHHNPCKQRTTGTRWWCHRIDRESNCSRGNVLPGLTCDSLWRLQWKFSRLLSAFRRVSEHFDRTAGENRPKTVPACLEIRQMCVLGISHHHHHSVWCLSSIIYIDDSYWMVCAVEVEVKLFYHCVPLYYYYSFC